MEGQFARIEPLDPDRHAASLHAANSLDAEGRLWTYMGYGPFADLAGYRAWVAASAASDDPLFYAIIDRQLGKAVAVASYLRIDTNAGSIEIGNICYSPLAQRTPVATESMYLFARHAFDELGYRRYEWKCDSFNVPSRPPRRH